MKKIALYESRRENNEYNLSSIKHLYESKNNDYEYYCDVVKSRMKTTNRPELKRLIKDVKEGKISKVIIPSINHISRNTEYVMEFVDCMNENNCAVFDKCNNEYGKEMLEIYRIMVQYEKDMYENRRRKFNAEKDYDNRREAVIDSYLTLNNISSIKRIGSEWNKFNIWFNEEKENRKIDLINTNIIESYYLYNILISHDGIPKINIVIKTEDSFENEDLKNEMLSEMYDKYIDYLEYPKLSNCSPLLQDLYNQILNSSELKIVVTNEDWEKDYLGKYTEEDYERLIDETHKLGLNLGIELNDYHYYDDDYYYENDEDEEYDFKLIIYKDLLSSINNDYALELKEELEI